MNYCTKCGKETDPNSMAYCPNCGAPIEGSEHSTQSKQSLNHDEDKKKGVKGWLSHPLLLIAVGAIVSSILIPELTSSWQINEKELELKLELADKMITCRNDLYHIAGRNIFVSLAGRYANVTDEECNEIRPMLDMYYSAESDIPERWAHLVYAMNNLIYLNKSLGPDRPYIPDSVEEKYKRAIITNILSNLTLPVDSAFVDELLLTFTDDERLMIAAHQILWKFVSSEIRNLIRTVLDSDLDIYKHGIFQ